MKKLILIFAVAFGLNSQAQEETYFSVDWVISSPLAQRDFISKTSFSGFEFGYHAEIAPNMTLGGTFGVSGYDDYTARETYDLENVTITTDLYKYQKTMNFMMHYRYMIETVGPITPVLTAGIGTMYSDYNVYFSTYNLYQEEWGLSFKPGIELLYRPVNRDGSYFKLGISYQYTNIDTDIYQMDSYSGLNINFGILFAN